MSALLDNIPPHTLATIKNYLIHGYEPGGFVTSMLAMDMEVALARADTANRQRMWYIGKYITEHLPEGSWGSYNAVIEWCENKDDRRSKWATWAALTNTEKEVDLDF